MVRSRWRTAAGAIGLASLAGLSGPSGNGAIPLRASQSEPVQAQNAGTNPPLQELLLQERIHFSAPPPELVETSLKCDQRGNIYLVYSDDIRGALGQPGGASLLPVQRVSPDSQTVLRYLPNQSAEYAWEYRIDFNVTPWGTVYMLLQAYHHWPRHEHEKPDFLIAKFKDDGTMDSAVRLGQPASGFLQAEKIAPFPGGGGLVAGKLVLDPVRGVAKPFTGVYDQGGNLVREVELSDEVASAPDRDVVPGQPGERKDQPADKSIKETLAVDLERLVAAPDGNVYLLRASAPPRLDLISPGGEILKEARVEFDRSGLTPIGMTLAGEDAALIQFAHIATPGEPEGGSYQTVLALVNLSSGHVTGLFSLPSDPEITPSGCATSQGQFLFLGTGKDGKLDVVKFVGH